MENDQAGGNSWVRCWLLMVFLMLAPIVVIGILAGVAFWLYEPDPERDEFLLICVVAGHSADWSVSSDVCGCMWDELRRFYAGSVILDKLHGSDGEFLFERRLRAAYVGCS